MHLDDARTHCLSLPHATESQPFGPDALVFKVAGKVFALLALDGAPRVSLKGEPEANAEARERYAGAAPGYHLNKRHWNTVALQDDVPADVVREMVDASHALVVAGLTRRTRVALGL